MFTDGTVIAGTWNRPDATKPAALTDGNGQPDPAHPGPHLGRVAEDRQRHDRPAQANDVLTFHG